MPADAPIAVRINSERLVVLGWPRAILLQLAHPLVAAGVAEHGSFQGSASSAVRRLHATVGAMVSIVFGSPERTAATLAGIRRIHERVHGHLRGAVGAFPAGTPYSANDPALLLWVHATLVESVVVAYDSLVAPLNDAERDRYCVEAAPTAVTLGAVAADVPGRWRDLVSYLEATRRSGAIAVGPDAARLAAGVLTPRLGPWPAPLAGIARRLTIGLLPDDVRAAYGFGWTDADARRCARTIARVRSLRRVLPRRVALWKQATIAPQ